MAARIAIFLAAAWLIGSLFLAFVATQNFATVDRVLLDQSAGAAPRIAKLGPSDARLLLRFLAGEENRLYFQAWEIAELGILAILLLLVLKSRLLSSLAVLALGITIAQHFWITPKLVAEGIAVAFSTAPDRLADFGKLHAVYGVTELISMALAVVITVLLIRGKRAGGIRTAPNFSEARGQDPASPQGFLHQGR
jgi:hypothetical protein